MIEVDLDFQAEPSAFGSSSPIAPSRATRTGFKTLMYRRRRIERRRCRPDQSRRQRRRRCRPLSVLPDHRLRLPRYRRQAPTMLPSRVPRSSTEARRDRRGPSQIQSPSRRGRRREFHGPNCPVHPSAKSGCPSRVGRTHRQRHRRAGMNADAGDRHIVAQRGLCRCNWFSCVSAHAHLRQAAISLPKVRSNRERTCVLPTVKIDPTPIPRRTAVPNNRNTTFSPDIPTSTIEVAPSQKLLHNENLTRAAAGRQLTLFYQVLPWKSRGLRPAF